MTAAEVAASIRAAAGRVESGIDRRALNIAAAWIEARATTLDALQARAIAANPEAGK